MKQRFDLDVSLRLRKRRAATMFEARVTFKINVLTAVVNPMRTVFTLDCAHRGVYTPSRKSGRFDGPGSHAETAKGATQMPTLLNANEARKQSELVQAGEAILAKNLYKEFNEGRALENLQNLAGFCIGTMLDDNVALQKACLKENQLTVWQKIGGNSRAALYEFHDLPFDISEGTFDASDVSDIIRLFGEFIEQGGAAGEGFKGPADIVDDWGTKLTPSMSVKQAYRGAVPGSQGTDKDRIGHVWGEIKYYGAKESKEKFGSIANVGTVKGTTMLAGDGVARRNRSDEGWEPEQHIDLRADKSAISGMKLKRAQEDSNILKIDRLFGLITGADISGTTADTICAVELLGHPRGINALGPIYYLLPLATIVYNNHHALLEVALALTLNGVIDYNIGFYTTLLPKDANPIPPELTGIDGILTQAENRFKNQRLVTFYNGKDELAGGFLFTDDEARRGTINAATLLKMAWNSLPRYPLEQTVRSLFLHSFRSKAA